MPTKNIKAGLSKANVNAIAGAIGTATLNRLVPQFSTSVSYTKGQYTNYNNQLYRFTADKSAGAWDSTKVESATLNDLINDVNGAVSSVVGKANTQDLLNGTLVPAKALTAEQIENVSEDVGSTQNAPFIFQATATDNGADSVETAPVAKHLKKLGNSVVVNQLNNNDGTTGDNAGITYTKNDDKSWTLSGTASALSYRTIHNNISFINGHKYLLFTTKSNANVGFYVYNSSQGVYQLAPTYGNSFVFTSSYSVNANLVFIVKDATNLTTPLTTKVYLIDLTQWFGSNSAIPQDLLDNPENASRYGMLGLAYNTGTLTNCNGRYLQCIGRNAFNKENATLNKIINTSGVETSVSGYFHSDYIKCIPNTNYNFKGAINWDVGGYVVWFDKNKNFITYNSTSGTMPLNVHTKSPANAEYMIMNGVSSAIDSATISLYYEDGTGYSDYYPYEENTYDTGTEVLRSAGSAKDVKLPSNEITRNVGSVDLGTLDWYYIEAYGFVATYNNVIKSTSNAIVGNLLCSKYNATNFNNVYSAILDKVIALRDSGSQYNGFAIRDTSYTDAASLKASLNGVYAYFELATPTTETGTSFPENIEVDNYGSMGWLDTDSDYVDIPQGSEFFYPADYVEFIDSLYTRSKDGGDSADVSNIVVKSEISEFVKQVDLSSGITTQTQGISIDNANAYKQGNVITLSLRLTNNGSSTISSNTEIFQISSSLYPKFSLVQPVGKYYDNSYSTAIININSGSGVVKTFTNLEVGSYLYISITYVV